MNFFQEIDEQRIKEDLKYQVNMAFTTRDAYDETSEELLPMLAEDLCEVQIDTNELLEALNEQREFPLYQV